MKALLRDLDELGQRPLGHDGELDARDWLSRHAPDSPVLEYFEGELPDVDGADRCTEEFKRMADLLQPDKCPYCRVALDHAAHRCNSHEDRREE